MYSSTSPPPSAPPPSSKEAPAMGVPVSEVPWSTGLCDCFSDVPNCCLTCWCPCITFGQVSEIVDKGASSCIANGAIYTLLAYVTGCACLYSCCYRSKMRRQYMLEDNACGDCMVHFFCEACALCQEHRELKNRGFDMSIGWEGNVERRTRGVTNMPPAFDGGMNR